MKSRILGLVVAFSLPLGAVLSANADSQSLGPCLVDSLTGKERKELAKWIFFGMAAHPAISSYAEVSPEVRVETDQYVGQLVTRLLVEDCGTELASAQKANPMALQTAFELVGQVAMQELMTDKGVQQAMSNYANYADRAKINALLTE